MRVLCIDRGPKVDTLKARSLLGA